LVNNAHVQPRVTRSPQARADPEFVRPSLWLALVPRVAVIVGAGLVLGGWAALRGFREVDWLLGFSAGVVVVGTLLDLAWVLTARYDLTRTHARARVGVLERRFHEIPLRTAQHVHVRQTFAQRVLGVGTVEVAAADGLPVVWSWVARPNDVAARLRGAIEEAHGVAHGTNAAGRDPTPRTCPVVGLVGGIGAGKSAVARALADLGCVVVDADKDAKEALDRSDVRAQLVSWWGAEVLAPSGHVDRSKVAAIVFADAMQRRRLEALVHPIVRGDRRAIIDRARREGRAGVVIDAPLLFEAGSDADCDAVIFVDAPREQRLARVAARGWSDEDLTRREAAQLPLEEKRRRSHVVVVNDADLGTLAQRVEEAWRSVRGIVASGATGTKPANSQDV
jgi:dephospho-CoA kinase